MAKSSIPTKQDIRNRLKDAQSGIHEGRASMNPTDYGKGVEEVLPTLDDMGLPVKARLEFALLVRDHVELGQVAKETEATRKTLGDQIKAFIKEHIGDEISKFFCGPNKVSIYIQNRTSFNAEIAKQTLLNAGVAPEKINKAWAAAVTVTPIETLRITSPGGSDV
jgi:DNA-binding ferritin-like protein (Dps family)